MAADPLQATARVVGAAGEVDVPRKGAPDEVELLVIHVGSRSVLEVKRQVAPSGGHGERRSA